MSREIKIRDRDGNSERAGLKDHCEMMSLWLCLRQLVRSARVFTLQVTSKGHDHLRILGCYFGAKDMETRPFGTNGRYFMYYKFVDRIQMLILRPRV